MEQVTGKGALQGALLSSRQRTEAGYSAECCRWGKSQAGTGLPMSSLRAALQMLLCICWVALWCLDMM